jgi:hypothetical protein
MYCPAWVYDIAVARAAAEYLSSDMTVEAFARKYSEDLSSRYQEISVEAIQQPAESMLMFLSEIEAGEMAVELLNDFAYFRLYTEAVGRPRKMKPMFGSLEDGVKEPQHHSDHTAKAFRAYIFGQRSNTVPKAPAGWRLEDDEHVPMLAEVAGRSLSVLDIL